MKYIILFILFTTSGLAQTETERVNLLKARIKAIYDQDAGMPSFYKIKNNVANWKIYTIKLIKDKARKEEAENFVTLLEEKHQEFLEEKALQESERNTCKQYIKAFNEKTEEDFIAMSEFQKNLMIFRYLKCQRKKIMILR